MLAAVFAALSIMTPIRLQNIKITFEGVPVLVGALLFGAPDGALVGFIGALVYQLFLSGYGVTVTTPLWILPHVVSGLVVGLFAQKKAFRFRRAEVVPALVVSELLVTAINTFAIYVDSKIFGYYTPTIITGVLGVRILAAAIRGVAYGLILPPVVSALRRQAGIMAD